MTASFLNINQNYLLPTHLVESPLADDYTNPVNITGLSPGESLQKFSVDKIENQRSSPDFPHFSGLESLRANQVACNRNSVNAFHVERNLLIFPWDSFFTLIPLSKGAGPDFPQVQSR
jgi:hypothetical protein